MSTTTKLKIEVFSVYTALAIILVCIVAIETITINRKLYGPQNRQDTSQVTTIQRVTAMDKTKVSLAEIDE